LPKKIYNKISGIKKEVAPLEIEEDIDVWRTLYLTKEIKIESMAYILNLHLTMMMINWK
jgi:hypothetical protein